MTNFKRYREFIGLKQCELAKRAGVSSVSVARLERNGCFDIRTAARYAEAMECNPLFLLEGVKFDFTKSAKKVMAD
jgi:transcriptional regulator with XRE-family HTH domain